jgi:DNA-binding NarL/FixJ family response regulator
VETARHARNELEALGAVRDVDAAAALMRSLGAKSRSGPRAAGLLSKREREVLRLLGEGLTNREIGARLYISPKTAEHHVSRVYAKIGVSTRAEAAAYAARNAGSNRTCPTPRRGGNLPNRRRARDVRAEQGSFRSYYGELNGAISTL